jgi:hypothetical protein
MSKWSCKLRRNLMKLLGVRRETVEVLSFDEMGLYGEEVT